MSEPVTPVAGENTPVAPAAPVAPQVPAAGESETVTMPKSEADQLRRDAARASSAQSRADRLAKVAGRTTGRFGTVPAAPAAPSAEEAEARNIEEDRKVERGLTGIALDPKYRDVLDSDPTLRNLLTQNPLAVLPMMASEALDAEDALELVREQLDQRLEARKSAAPVAPTVPAAPPTGPINAKDQSQNEELEQVRKDPNTERAIAGMIKIGLRAKSSNR